MAGRRRRRPWWGELTDEELLDVRLCDLRLDIGGSALEGRVHKLYDELERAGLRFRPHVWLSTGWFSPYGVPGIAVPFFLAHPRLARLEGRQMLEVEGGTQDGCLRLLRHEAGHALDTAHRLRRRRRWRELFGSPSQPYRSTYVPRPHSRRFVMNLENWYAQSHPLEDFAETFAVWLKPRSAWRRQYTGWPALRKLAYVDELMREIGERPAPVRSRERVDSLPGLRSTLRDYYRKKKAYYGEDFGGVYDRDLLRLFSEDPGFARRRTAAAFLRRHRSELRRQVSRWTGQHPFAVDGVLGAMIARSRALGLRMAHGDRETAEGAAVLLTVQTMRAIRARYREFVR